MWANNFCAFLIHFVIGLVTYLLGAITIKGGPVIVNSITVLLTLVALVAYILIGKVFLEKQESKFKDLISVSFVAILGFIITALIVPIEDINPLVLYFGYAVPLISILPSTDTLHLNPVFIESIGFTLLSIAPSFCLWVGIEMKSSKMSS